LIRLVTLPGVYRPRADTHLLTRALLAAAPVLRGRAVLDLCTGTGALAVTAAVAGGDVLAVDVSRRAVANVRFNALLNGVRVRAVEGDLWQPVRRRRFDLVVSNPPYLPAPSVPGRGRARAWDAGRDGRALLDPICREAAVHLRPGGRLLLIQSSLADPDASQAALEASGLRPRVLARVPGPLGPLASARRGLHGQDSEELVVIEASAARPGVGVAGQPGNDGGKLAADDVREGHVFEHGA